MPVTLQDLGIDRMSVDERLALVQAIWDSIAESRERPALTHGLRDELDRRLADHEENPAEIVSWDDVRAAAINRLKQ
jgi:putative addiction module component (TIGR02574 family)